MFPRSSNAKKDLILSNSVGVLDSNYRGEVMLKFKPQKQGGKMYEVGDRIGQIIIMPYPHIEFKEVEELSETNRGDGGFGSTGSNMESRKNDIIDKEVKMGIYSLLT